MNQASGSQLAGRRPVRLQSCRLDGTTERGQDAVTRGALPSLIVIGAMKCATTALHDYLDAHPDITMSRPKELNFFSGCSMRDLARYAAHFDAGSKLRGESSPGYTSPSFPDVAARMASTVPDVRLVYVVRDPVERALSQYRHHRRDHTERRPLEEAVLDTNSQYISRSKYYERLQPFLHHFDPAQIHVVVQERLLADRRHEMTDVYRHVGAEEVEALQLPKAPDRRSSGAAVPPAVRSALWGHVRPDVEQLRHFMQDRLLEWNDRAALHDVAWV